MSRKRTRIADLSATSLLANFACKRCRSRKVKCDAEFPQCAGCAKAGVPCIVADYSTARDFTRLEVQALEEKVAELEGLVDASNGAGTHGSGEQPQRSLDATRFVGPESGFNFIQPIVEAMRRQGHPSPQRQEPLIEIHAPHHLPTRDVTQRIVSEYLREFHVCHPVLDEAQITVVVEDVYSQPDDYRVPTGMLSRSKKQNLFQLNMVLAIGSIRLHRNILVPAHPFGFFTAALDAHPPSDYRFCEIEDVENLLLIALFGLFYNIGCSIWELSRLCVRVCIELQLHCQRSGSLSMSDAEVQRRRRVFWESYLLDRFSSAMLGRPYAISDAVIDIDVPHELSGDPFSHLVRMGRITSDMHVSLSYPKTPRGSASSAVEGVNSGNLFSTLRTFHGKLRLWRFQVPIFEQQNCGYETPEFFDLSFQESRLWLFRAAINNLTAGVSGVREKLLLLCLQAAQQVIGCFDTLWQRDLAISSRSSTRLILIAGLITVAVFKLQTSQRLRSPVEDDVSNIDIDFWLEDLGLDPRASYPTVAAFRETIGTAGRILSGLAAQMPDVVAYAQFFRMLEREVEKFDDSTLSTGALAGQAPANRSTPISGATYDPVVTGSALGSSQARKYCSHGNAQQHGDLNALGLGLYEQQANGASALDDLLSNMYPGEHFPGNEGGALLGSDAFSSFPHASWMQEIDGDISGFVWDTAMPWQGSPFANT